MSHIVAIKSQLRDRGAIEAACHRLGLPQPVEGTAQLYSSSVEGLQIRLPGWKYPVVVNPETGEVQFDNFGGQWGEQSQLDRFVQAYSVEKTKIEARKQGLAVTEQAQADGSIKVTLTQY